MFKLRKKPRFQRKSDAANKQERPISEVIQAAHQTSDFKQDEIVTPEKNIWLSYYVTLVDQPSLNKLIIKELQRNEFTSLNDMKRFLTIDEMTLTTSGTEVSEKLLQGHIIIQLEKNDEVALIVPLLSELKRDINIPEIEFTVIGPKEAFVEAIDANIHLIRKRIPNSELLAKEMKVGTLTESRVVVMYLRSIANDDNVQTMIQRIEGIDIDQLMDSSILVQLISDDSFSPFPEFLETERPDRVAASLCEGKVIALVDGSPQAIIGPSTLVEFFSALEDYFVDWQVASAIRILRLFAVWFSIFATPLYVAFLTYHIELIPQDLLATLIMSRSIIPFPPILEVLFLEVTIELLREAGARLPTKVGQTIGIVGGIVIGTAAVEAGLTSNVLLIIVALAALASFTTPVYRMGNTIRFIRFPFIFAAELWGVISISLLFCLFIVHLLTLRSLGRPYLEPIYPPRIIDYRDSFIRLPIKVHSTRPYFLQTKQPKRFDKKKALKKKDIDE